MSPRALLAIAAASVAALVACSSSSSSGGGGAGGGRAGGGGVDAGGGSLDGGACEDTLKTGLVATQTGVSVDKFDCQILFWAKQYEEPDPMIFKAIIYVESRFDDVAVACPNDPCGTPKGWTTAESGCFGLMQVVPACDGIDAGLLPGGQPNLTMDASAAGWAGSIFNPDVNIQIGISGVAGNRAQVEKQFPGCTTEQYTMMAIGNYNSYGSTTSCTSYNNAYDGPLVTAYQMYATAAHYPAQSYMP